MTNKNDKQNQGPLETQLPPGTPDTRAGDPGAAPETVLRAFERRLGNLENKMGSFDAEHQSIRDAVSQVIEHAQTLRTEVEKVLERQRERGAPSKGGARVDSSAVTYYRQKPYVVPVGQPVGTPPPAELEPNTALIVRLDEETGMADLQVFFRSGSQGNLKRVPYSEEPAHQKWSRA